LNKDITLTIDQDGIFLQATYECVIHRRKNSDGSGRTWWEPELQATLIRADLTNKDDEEFEWFYGDPRPRAIDRAIELYEGKLEQLLADKVSDIIHSFNFEDKPYVD